MGAVGGGAGIDGGREGLEGRGEARDPARQGAARAVAALRRPGAGPDRARPRPRAGAALPGAPGIRGLRLHEAAADDLRAARPARPARRAAARARARVRPHGDEQPRPRRLPADHAPARGPLVARVAAARRAVRRGVLVVRPLREDRVDRALLELRLSTHGAPAQADLPARALAARDRRAAAKPPALPEVTRPHDPPPPPPSSAPGTVPGDPQRDPGAKPTPTPLPVPIPTPTGTAPPLPTPPPLP